MRETPVVKEHEEPLLLMEEGLVPVSGGEAAFRAIDGHRLRAPVDMTGAEAVEAGEKAYRTYCAQCHGTDHDGNGTVGQSFHPLPGDLRSLKVQSMPEGVIFKEVSYGIPNGRQPPLATTVSVTDRWHVIAYIKSLGTRE
jgi:mono/diheme cytochrome c family protein